MRKRTVRAGLRLMLAALLLIVISSFFHSKIAAWFSLSMLAEHRLYNLGMFWSAAMGGYGVVLAALGFVLPTDKRDEGVRVMPAFFWIACVIGLFFYLLMARLHAPPDEQRLSPDSTITI